MMTAGKTSKAKLTMTPTGESNASDSSVRYSMAMKIHTPLRRGGDQRVLAGTEESSKPTMSMIRVDSKPAQTQRLTPYKEGARAAAELSRTAERSTPLSAMPGGTGAEHTAIYVLFSKLAVRALSTDALREIRAYFAVNQHLCFDSHVHTFGDIAIHHISTVFADSATEYQHEGDAYDDDYNEMASSSQLTQSSAINVASPSRTSCLRGSKWKEGAMKDYDSPLMRIFEHRQDQLNDRRRARTLPPPLSINILAATSAASQ
jgi:hypothetical protein